METEEIFNDNQPKQNMRSKNWPAGDIIIGILIIIYAVLMFIGAQYFPHRARMGTITSARFTPILLSILVIILCSFLIIKTIRKCGKVSINDWFREMISDETMRRSYVLIVMIGVYIFLVGRIQFVVINTLYLFAIYWYLKIGSWKIILIYSLVGGLLVSVVVPRIFQMPLP
jgi:hypothetical protein